MPKHPKRKRPRKLSLHPLSLEEALKKALAIPFVAPKKRKKQSPHRSLCFAGFLILGVTPAVNAEQSGPIDPQWTNGQVLTTQDLTAAETTTGIVVRYAEQVKALRTALQENRLSTEQAAQRVSNLEDQLSTLQSGLALTQREAELANKEAQLAQHAAGVNNWIIAFVSWIVGLILGWLTSPHVDAWRNAAKKPRNAKPPRPTLKGRARPTEAPPAT